MEPAMRYKSIFDGPKIIRFRRPKLSLQQLNELTPGEFHKTFENVIECWPEAAIFCSALLPFKSFVTLVAAFENYLERLPADTKLKILRLYPDLAGKMLDTNQLSEDSSNEHASVGLDNLSPEDKRTLTDLNESYKAKFGFPFVVCVREASKFEVILRSVSERIHHTAEQELAIALGEVKKICRLRILQVVDNL
ncbi:2-oxo-4-hydroxy-4-carboxy-5-ureidoimidazoline decarboxylase-like [Anopheles maculipalpis]|uniref:2-oxo-4-hydroxy-4-carboxy-5-ureidoimidazoline decarboxylase-like n=1 Tax=Anopheles maculipalpis TaxID=1496333 RepID=UPI0021596D76|nr:2-oxo-4-hydroxy-4-carboxy-5-ureidoimidazoline decarboxylase-like [Anopheles maculipalpis]